MILKCIEDDDGKYEYMMEKECNIEDGEFCHVTIEDKQGKTRYTFYCGIL